MANVVVPLLDASPTLYSPGVGHVTEDDEANPPVYECQMVNIYGGSVLALPQAQPETITWTLNEPSEAEITFPKHEYDSDDIPALGTPSSARELQIYRNGDIMHWGPVLQPDGSGSRGEVRAHSVDPLWVLNRRNIDAPRDNRLENADFEDDYTSWSAVGVTNTISTARKVLGTKSAKLVTATANGETYISQTVSLGPNGVGILVTVAGWFWLDSCTAPAIESRGLYIEGRESGLFKRRNYSAIDTATDAHVWTRREAILRIPPNKRWEIETRCYCPQGTIYWDAITTIEPDSTGVSELTGATGDEADIASIAGVLVRHVQLTSMGKSDLHVGTHTPANGVTLLRQYQFAEHVGFEEAMREFTDRDDGFDIGIELTPTTRSFHTYSPRKGTDLSGSVTLTFGGNVADYRFSRNGGATITRATTIGEGDGPDREEGEYVDATQIGGTILQEVRQAPPEAEINSLLPISTERVNKRNRPPLILELDLTPDAGLIHTLKVGDRVSVVVSDGYVEVSGTHRIVKMTLTCRTNVLTVFVNEEDA